MPCTPPNPMLLASWRKLPPVFLGVLLLLTLASAPAQTGSANYVFSHLAGPLGGPGNADGTGAAARFWHPNGIAVDSAGNVYVADTDSGTIRKIAPGGTVTTLAGTAKFPGVSSFSTAGPDTSVWLGNPTGLAVDSTGNVYVADSGDHTIRKITSAGAVTTLAGTIGLPGAADGTGAAARFNSPWSVAVDSAGNVYVADSANNTIRKITPAGIVTTLAGTAGVTGSADSPAGAASGAAAQFNDPTGVAVDNAGNVYVADSGNQTIRKIAFSGGVTTLAGTVGAAGSTDGTGATARFDNPTGVTVDSSGNLYVTDEYNSTVRKITANGVVTTLAGLAGATGGGDGTGSAARFNNPTGVAVDGAGNVAVADPWNCTIRRITPAGIVTTLAGNAAQPGTADGTGIGARFGWTSGVAVDAAGTVYATDIAFNGTGLSNTVRKITPGGAVTTLAVASVVGISSPSFFVFLPLPQSGIAVDTAGNVYVADWLNQTIRKITPGGTVTTLAGSAGVRGSADGTGAAAQFNNPAGLAVDAAGNVFVADSGNYTIRKVTPGGAVTTLAGTTGVFGSADGTGAAAQFANPGGLAIDATGNIFVADTGDSTIRKVTPGGVVTTITDKIGDYPSTDGSGITKYYYPAGLALDAAGNIYVGVGSAIQKVTPAGVVTTIGGVAGICGSADGAGPAAQFNLPYGLAFDRTGNLYVADINNSAIRLGMPAGPPVISSQPQSQSVASGNSAQFSITVGSALAYTCQWNFNGSAISGATSTALNLASISAGNAGDYTVVVTNASGSVTSNKATLTVGSAAVTPPASGGGSGGGGALEGWFAGLLGLLLCCRQGWRRNQAR